MGHSHSAAERGAPPPTGFRSVATMTGGVSGHPPEMKSFPSSRGAWALHSGLGGPPSGPTPHCVGAAAPAVLLRDWARSAFSSRVTMSKAPTAPRCFLVCPTGYSGT